MMFRKLFVQILCFIMVLSSIVSAAPIASEVETYDLYAYNTMSALSIIDGNLQPEQIVTREVFARVVAKVMGFHTDKKADKSYFYDVEDEGIYTADINYLVENDIISGYDGAVFMPEKSISVEEMITMLVSVAGYKQVALCEGGYPRGFVKQLDRMNIRLRVPSNAKELSVAEMSELVYEFFNARSLGVGSVYADGSVELTAEKNLSEIYLGIKKYEGILTGTEQTTIYEDTYLGQGSVQIDDVKYYTDKDYCELIGYYVEYYADEDNNLYYMVPARKKNETVKLMSKYIVNSFVDRKLVYKTDSGQKKAYDISDVCSYIHNGKFDVFNFNKLIGHDGDITLIDNNRDGVYDVVFCNKYDVYVVGEVSEARKIIIDKFNKNHKLELQNNKIHRLRIYDTEKEISLSDIKKGDVLFCLEGGTNKISLNIIRSNKTVSGNVDAISEEYIQIDGEKFYLSQYLINSQKNSYVPVCTIGTYGMFALTPYGEIAYYISDAQNSQLSYGYLYKKYNNPESDTGISFMIMSQEGEWLKVNAAKKVIINKRRKEINDILYDSAFDTQQLITYKLNSYGEISVINFVQHRADNTIFDVSEGIFRSRFSRAESREYKNTDKYFVKGGAVDFFIKDDTIIFVVPQNKTTANIDEDYYVAGPSYFKSGNAYTIQPFDETAYNVPSVVVVEEANDNTMQKMSAATNFVVVDKIKKMFVDGEECDILYGYSGGILDESFVANKNGLFVREDGSQLQRGDLVIVNRDYFGKVIKIKIVKLADSEPQKAVEGAHAEEFQYIYGKVVRIGDGYMTIKNSSNTFRMICSNPTVTVYNKVWNEVRQGDITEICTDDEVVVRNSVSRVKEIVLYE